MRGLIATIAAIACITILVLGYLNWKDKTNISSFSASKPVAEEKQDDDEKGKIGEEDEKPNIVDSEIFQLTKNWPDAAREQFKSIIEAGGAFKIAIGGSYALGEGNGWAKMLKDELMRVYGDSVDVLIFEYDNTSAEFINEGNIDEVKAAEADLILYEPFTLKDNGVIDTEDNHENIESFIEEMKEANEDVVVILQPPHPIRSETTFYFGQVDELKAFAEEREIPYLDHWEMWPGQEEIAEYVTSPVQYAPNEKGHQIWFKFLHEYFIAEEK